MISWSLLVSGLVSGAGWNGNGKFGITHSTLRIYRIEKVRPGAYLLYLASH